jgi:hypothetical protein
MTVDLGSKTQILTVDLEEYFQVEAFSDVATATFFVVG